MWILKEPYDSQDKDGNPIGGGWSIPIHCFEHPQEWALRPSGSMVTCTSYGIMNNVHWENIDYISDNPDVAMVLQQIAYINLSKMPDKSRTDDSTLWGKYDIWRDILLKQIKTYDPEVIIFGNTFQYFQKDLGILSEPDLSKNKINFFNTENGRLLIDGCHPGACHSYDSQSKYVNTIVDVVHSWKTRKTLI